MEGFEAESEVFEVVTDYFFGLGELFFWSGVVGRGGEGWHGGGWMDGRAYVRLWVWIERLLQW